LLGVKSIVQASATAPDGLSGHVVLVGYGVAGKLVAHALDGCGVPYVALELNAETVLNARKANKRVYYGDATSEEALGHAHIDKARALLLLMNDPFGAERVVHTAKRIAPEIPILMRARYLGEKDLLRTMGATDVVAEEVEGGLEILARLLRWLEVPRNVIDDRVDEARASTQTTARKVTVPRRGLPEHEALADLKIESVLVTETSAVRDQSIASIELRQRTGALIIAIRRAGMLVDSTDPNAPLVVGDIVYLAGPIAAVKRAMELLAKPGEK
jgi:CPA2 family monovalent cation:H+ antiporter-2